MSNPPQMEQVMGFLFSPDLKEIVLIKKGRPPELNGLWNGPGGKMEPLRRDRPKETPLAAMQREFLEETGLLVKEWTHFCFFTQRNRVVIHCFRGVSEAFLEVQSKTDEEVAVFELEDLPTSTLAPALKWLIPLALDNRQTASVITK